MNGARINGLTMEDQVRFLHRLVVLNVKCDFRRYKPPRLYINIVVPHTQLIVGLRLKLDIISKVSQRHMPWVITF